MRATCQQADRLLTWAEPLGPRTWAVESAGGLGYLLSQQLVGAGEQVLDVPPVLSDNGAIFTAAYRNGVAAMESTLLSLGIEFRHSWTP